MTPSEHLRLAAALIADEERWTQGVKARNDEGEPCNARSQFARRWCATGALIKVLHDNCLWHFWNEANEFMKVYGDDIAWLNDTYGHAYTIGAMMHVADKLDGLA